MNSQVSSVHKGMPSHLKVGLVLASINGMSCLGWPHSLIMDELRKKVRPLSIQFVDQILDATSAPLHAFDASALLTPAAALAPTATAQAKKPKRRLQLRHRHGDTVVKQRNVAPVPVVAELPNRLLSKIRPGPVEAVRASVGDEVPEEDEEAELEEEAAAKHAHHAAANATAASAAALAQAKIAVTDGDTEEAIRLGEEAEAQSAEAERQNEVETLAVARLAAEKKIAKIKEQEKKERTAAEKAKRDADYNSDLQVCVGGG